MEWPAFLTLDPLVWQPAVNVAIGGTNTAQMLARGANVDATYTPQLKKNIAIINGGTNDSAAGISPAQSWANLAAWSADRHVKGFLTIVTTLFCGNPINPFIYANWVGTFDGLADPAANPDLGAVGACRNTDFFLDGIHPNEPTAQNLVEPVAKAAILAQ